MKLTGDRDKGWRCTRRSMCVALAVGWLGTSTRVLAIAFGLATPTPTPVATPTPTPTPTATPTPEPPGPKAYNFPADGSFVSIVLPVGWIATPDRSGKLLCAPANAGVGYSAVLAVAGNFSNPELARSYLNATVKEAVSLAKVGSAKFRQLETGKLGSGVDCFIQIVEGKLGSVPTSYVFMCFAPLPGRYVVFIAHGRTDKLSASGFDVIGAMADSIKGL